MNTLWIAIASMIAAAGAAHYLITKSINAHYDRLDRKEGRYYTALLTRMTN